MGKGLKRKLIYWMIGVGAIPLLLAMIISYIQGNKSLEEVIGNNFKALAFETSSKIDYLLENEIVHNRRLAMRLAPFASALAANRATRNLDSAALKSFFAKESRMWSARDEKMKYLVENPSARVLKNFLKEDTVSVQSTQALFITNADGILIASINFYPDFVNSSLPFSRNTQSRDKKKVYISDLYLDTKLDLHVFQLSVPIRDQGGRTLGAIHRIYSAKEFFAPNTEPITFGETGHVMLINSKGIVLDCPILPTGFKLKGADLVRSVTGAAANWVLTHEDGHGGNELSIIGFSPLLATNRYLTSSTGENWFTFVWQSSDELFAPTRELFLWISAAVLFSVLLIAIMGTAASEKIVKPIKQLEKVAAQIGRGEKVEPIKIRTGDEIESLARQINQMNRMLQKSFSGLEQQVQIKTRELRDIKEYTEKIFMSIPEVVLIFNQDLKIEYVNTALGRLVERRGWDFIGKGLGELESSYKDQWKMLADGLEDFAQGVVAKRSRRVGERVIHCYEARDPLAPQFPSDASQPPPPVITLGDRSFTYQYFNVSLDEKKTRKLGLMMKEITEEKKLMDQLTMADKLSGLGTLTAGIAHEINNPLYSIMGYTEAIQEEKNPVKIKEYAAKVLSSSKHVASIILNLSGYARSNIKAKTQDVNINERLDAAIEIARVASYSDDIQLEKNYQPLPLLKSKPEEIQQIFVNIIQNAVQAMQGKGRLSISSLQSNGNIVVTIRDTGPGIPQEHLSKIFDPFFTTKDQGEGTGLGLNIVHRIVHNYGGTIQVDSRDGKGSAFKISFPVELSR
ncbi:MAG: ATP-binding protein [Nitrospinales bacterium]